MRDMNRIKSTLFILVWVCLLAFVPLNVCSEQSGLRRDFYKENCPFAESIVRDVTWREVRNNPSLPAHLLRTHFHDCFVRGCDASILLDTVGTNQSEKDDEMHNRSLMGFDVIDDIKTEIEKECPEIVSCADILSLAARDAISFQYKIPMWEVVTGRRDGNVSLAKEVHTNIPHSFSNFARLTQLFSSKGLDVNDLVVLSGAHTIGKSHCHHFSRRIYNFTGKGDIDPSLDSTYAEYLKILCSNNSKNLDAEAVTVDMDTRNSTSFDNHYYQKVSQKMGLFQSDSSLLTNNRSAQIVKRLATSNIAFYSEFGKSIGKLGAIQVLTGTDGEIRKQCRFVNP